MQNEWVRVLEYPRLSRPAAFHQYRDYVIKLALKVAGRPMADAEAGPVTWDVWMRKK